MNKLCLAASFLSVILPIVAFSEDLPRTQSQDLTVQKTTSSLPANPFGISVAYILMDYNTQAERDNSREFQLNLALDLTGVGGKVRLWCYIGGTWNAPYVDGATECARAVQGAYARGLVPVIVMTDLNISPSDDKLLGLYNGSTGAWSYATTAAKVKSFVSRLPIQTDRELWIELANEPNFSHWWQSWTCNWWIRAYEVARQSEQVARAIRSLGKPTVKIAGPSLAAFSDTDPVPDANGECRNRGATLRLRSSDFIVQMKLASPALFSTSKPLLDAWNVHAYPLAQYGLCQTGACPAAESDFAMTYYKEDLRAAGLPANFPVLITEFGHPSANISTEGADFLARHVAGSLWSGAIPNIFLPKTSDNNVIGFMGYILYLPGDTFSWLGGASTPFVRMKALREALLPAWQKATRLATRCNSPPSSSMMLPRREGFLFIAAITLARAGISFPWMACARAKESSFISASSIAGLPPAICPSTVAKDTAFTSQRRPPWNAGTPG